MQYYTNKGHLKHTTILIALILSKFYSQTINLLVEKKCSVVSDVNEQCSHSGRHSAYNQQD